MHQLKHRHKQNSVDRGAWFSDSTYTLNTLYNTPQSIIIHDMHYRSLSQCRQMKMVERQRMLWLFSYHLVILM